MFYIAATIVVAGYRSANVADRIGRVSDSPDVRLTESPSEPLVNLLPNFGHSKRETAPGIIEASVLTFSITQIVIRDFEDLPRIEYSSLLDRKSAAARAPPALTLPTVH